MGELLLMLLWWRRLPKLGAQLVTWHVYKPCRGLDRTRSEPGKFEKLPSLLFITGYELRKLREMGGDKLVVVV